MSRTLRSLDGRSGPRSGARHWVVPYLLGSLIACSDDPSGPGGETLVYSNDFSGTVGTEWSSEDIATSPSGEHFLGEFGSEGPELTLTGLPAHSELVLEFDLYIIDSWNGNGSTTSGSAPDILTFEVVGGPLLKQTTFSNKPADPQAFPGNFPGGSFAAGTDALDVNALGYPDDTDQFGDSIYRLRFVFPHTGSSISLLFGSQQSSAQNEVWGIDNVRVLAAQ